MGDLRRRVARLEARAPGAAPPTHVEVEIDGLPWRRLGGGPYLLVPETIPLDQWAAQAKEHYRVQATRVAQHESAKDEGRGAQQPSGT